MIKYFVSYSFVVEDDEDETVPLEDDQLYPWLAKKAREKVASMTDKEFGEQLEIFDQEDDIDRMFRSG